MTITRSRPMKDVDEALRRAYSQRRPIDLPSGVPPGPHRLTPSHAHGPRPHSLQERGLSSRNAHRSAGFPVESDRINSVPVDAETLRDLDWPSVVMVLEREWG